MAIKKIRIRRGLKADLPVLSVGELGFVTDTEELFVGTDTGNILVTSTNTVDSVNGKTGEIILTPEDIGAAPIEHSHDYIEPAQLDSIVRGITVRQSPNGNIYVLNWTVDDSGAITWFGSQVGIDYID